MIWKRLGTSVNRIRLRPGTGRVFGNQQTTSAESRHSEWYRDVIPGMIPVALLGSSVYLVCGSNLGTLFGEPTVGTVRRDYNLHEQNCHMRNRCPEPRSALQSSRRVSNTSNHKLRTCLSKGLYWRRIPPGNRGGGEVGSKIYLHL